MNTTKTLLSLAIFGLLFTGCKDSASAPTASADNETAANTPAGKIETASFTIEGMTCQMGCANTIEKKLTSIDGVKKAAIDFEKKTAVVEFDTAKTSPEKIVAAVEAVADGKSYKVSNLKSSGDRAMLIDPEKKPKKKKKAKKGDKKAEATEASTTEAAPAPAAKPGCCSAKKACSSGEKAGTL